MTPDCEVDDLSQSCFDFESPKADDEVRSDNDLLSPAPTKMGGSESKEEESDDDSDISSEEEALWRSSESKKRRFVRDSDSDSDSDSDNALSPTKPLRGARNAIPPLSKKALAQSGAQVKRRETRACVVCRNRKVRCDASVNGTPCHNCFLDGIECVLFDYRRQKTTVAPREQDEEREVATTMVATEGGKI